MTKTRCKMLFSGLVVEHRERLDLTQQQLAETVSVSVRWIQKIEKGTKLPGFLLAAQIIHTLAIDANAFILMLSSDLPRGEAVKHVSIQNH